MLENQETNRESEPVSVVINVYNEAETIEAEIREIYEQIVSRIPGSEFIIAEDGSTDGTKEIIGRLVREIGIIHSTGLERKGYIKALCDAFALAKNPYIFFSDTGHKHDPADFWQLYLYRKLNGLVVGLKTDRSDQLYRRLLTWGYNQLLSLYFGVKVKDADSGFRLYGKEVVKKIFNEKWINKDLVASEIVLRVIFSGFLFREVPVSYRQRIGESRGLPLKKIPRVIIGVLGNFSKLKTAISDPRYKQMP
ncbi:glycosyltransferase family 2 protein [Candidatus Wolfebacteria bacterium]|nr:glycosyltransferase family 2 protein [Candidatus Wolfebacteria bacterium]